MFVVIKWDDEDLRNIDIVTDDDNNIRKFGTFKEAVGYGLLNLWHFKVREIGTIKIGDNKNESRS